MPAAKVAAVCCSPSAGGTVMFLLVRSRNGSRWTFPKGTVEPTDASPATAAAREALEEAGITGVTDPVPLGSYQRLRPVRKWADGADEIETVQAWLHVFTGIQSTGEPGRRPTWFTTAQAAAAFRSNPDDAVFNEQLCAMLERACARLFPDQKPPAV